MIEVINGKIAERESFITLIGTLSIPGALFVDINNSFDLFPFHGRVKENSSEVDILVGRRRAHLVHNYI